MLQSRPEGFDRTSFAAADGDDPGMMRFDGVARERTADKMQKPTRLPIPARVMRDIFWKRA
jgi:hypothetical protein